MSNTEMNNEEVSRFTLTDEDGYAIVHATMFDGRADIHYAYNVDAVCYSTTTLRGCSGPTMTVLALTPYRKSQFPRDAYMAGGCLYLAPQFLADFPDSLEALRNSVGESHYLDRTILPAAATARLLEAGVLFKDDRGYLQWIPNVHGPRPLDDVKPMLTGDWYE